MSYAMHAGLHGHGMDTLSETVSGPHADPDQAASGLRQIRDHLRQSPAGRGRAVCRRGCGYHAAPVATVQTATAQRRVTKVYETLERPLVPVLAAMERSGIKVDRDTLSRMSNAFAQKMAGLEDEIYELAGRKFNVGSPKQLGEILFDEMGLKAARRARPGPMPPGRMCLRIWRLNMNCRRACWTGVN